MVHEISRRSRFTRYSWLGLALFFIVFCSCPVKRFFKLQLYKESNPIESNSSNAAFAKELKDCNLIDKHGIIQVVRFTHIAGPKPLLANTDVVPFVFFLSSFIAAGLLLLFKGNGTHAHQRHYSYGLANAMPLYLQCHRLQV